MSDPRRWTVPGSRETARIAWRARVNAAARDFGEAKPRIADLALHIDATYAYGEAVMVASRLHAALTAPRPWRSTRRPDPRRRYSRAHRRACDGCRMAWRVTVMCGMRNGVGDMWTAYGWVDPTGCAATMRRDPKGRRS